MANIMRQPQHALTKVQREYALWRCIPEADREPQLRTEAQVAARLVQGQQRRRELYGPAAEQTAARAVVVTVDEASAVGASAQPWVHGQILGLPTRPGICLLELFQQVPTISGRVFGRLVDIAGPGKQATRDSVLQKDLYASARRLSVLASESIKW
jgi:hypothetical protein